MNARSIIDSYGTRPPVTYPGVVLRDDRADADRARSPHRAGVGRKARSKPTGAQQSLIAAEDRPMIGRVRPARGDAHRASGGPAAAKAGRLCGDTPEGNCGGQWVTVAAARVEDPLMLARGSRADARDVREGRSR